MRTAFDGCRRLATLALSTAALAGSGLAVPEAAHADAVAYLVNVTVRPGYNFAGADQALAYGHGICDKVTSGLPYGQVIGEVKADFGTGDEHQASYLINQAVNELCPAAIWQLRNSAVGYRAPVG